MNENFSDIDFLISAGDGQSMENIVYEYYHDKDTELHVAAGHSSLAKPHFHRCTEILYVTDGKVDSSVGDAHFCAEADEIVFVHNYYRHAFAPAEPYEKLVLIIPFNYADDFDAAFRHSTLPAHLTDKDFNREVLRPVFEKLYDDRKSMPPLVKKGYVNVLLGNMLSRYSMVPIERNGNIELLVGVLNYIEEHCDKPLTLDSLAATFGYNKYYFSRLFNRYIGENLNNYVNIVRLQRFMRLTKKDENASISELAFSCGFDSLTTFYRYFNKIYGGTPKAVLSAAK